LEELCSSRTANLARMFQTTSVEHVTELDDAWGSCVSQLKDYAKSRADVSPPLFHIDAGRVGAHNSTWGRSAVKLCCGRLTSGFAALLYSFFLVAAAVAVDDNDVVVVFVFVVVVVVAAAAAAAAAAVADDYDVVLLLSL